MKWLTDRNVVVWQIKKDLEGGLTVVAQGVPIVSDVGALAQREILGVNPPYNNGTSLADLIGPVAAAAVRDHLDSALTELAARAQILPAAPTEDDVIAAAEVRVQQLKAARAAKG